ncbi:hypothetical protein WDZ16_02660 [Pseudokineococcus marinus]|uniref:Asp23/Gls24 family envelope stress response protein n=1 Tax=Pseudokineococcus marinus TaxID=351215 RepID=A0A849BRK9_9ACTN|nr:hypothetical protein [Pseudokineococcus marinus]NNH23637.1 hypothetical protein [Pseudokineococcus marinus]
MTAAPAGEPRPGTAPVREAPVEEPTDADRVRAAVLAAPGVVDLHGGPLGEVGTYLPGRRVAGVRLGDGSRPTEVHVVASTAAPLAQTAAAVHAALAPLAALTGPVHVVVGDVAPPGGSVG